MCLKSLYTKVYFIEMCILQKIILGGNHRSGFIFLMAEGNDRRGDAFL